MTYDESKGLTITYHMLNLPDSISINSQNGLKQSRYIYDADGDKLANIRNGDSTVYYIDGIQYGPFLGVRSYLPAFVQTEEGRMFPYSTDTSAYYQYYFTDHLGNTRVTFDSHTATATKVQQDDYLPFGMEINRSLAGSPKNEYLYNRKELQENTQLYDYGARLYDPVIARWTSIDPLAEKGRRWSPYVYGENNSILNIDPDGMETQGSRCCGTPILFPATQKIAKAAGKLIVNTIAFVTNLIDGENSHRSFSKDPAVRAEAQRELKGYAAASVVMAMTDGLMGRVASTFGTTVTSNSVWALDSSERGFAVEQMLGGNLPYGFPVIDKFENGIATSIKSIDVTADSYTKGNRLFNTLKSYINKLDRFQGAAKGDFRISNSDITSKILEVGIQPGKATLNQWEQIGSAMKYAKDNNIEFKLQFVK